MLEQLLTCIFFCCPQEAEEGPRIPEKPLYHQQHHHDEKKLDKLIADNAHVEGSNLQANVEQNAFVVAQVAINHQKGKKDQ